MATPEWVPHLWNLLLRSVETLRSWSGVGWAAIAVSVLTFLVKLGSTAYKGYTQRYSKFSWYAAGEVLWALRPTIMSITGRFAIACWILLFGIDLAMTVYRDHMGLVLDKRRWTRIAVDDDQRIEPLIHLEMSDMHIRQNLDDLEPYLQLEITLWNMSIFTLSFDHTDGAVRYHDSPLQGKAEPMRPLSIPHGGYGFLVLRQPLTSDSARIMRRLLPSKPSPVRGELYTD